jgi:hypothetical protein
VSSITSTVGIAEVQNVGSKLEENKTMPTKPFLVKQKKIIKKKQRHRKSQEENKVLMLHFKRNKKWDKKKMEELI